jgi:hypothetical protein
MKNLLSVVLVAVLVLGVAGTLAGRSSATFFDTETSSDNEMGAGTRSLFLTGGPLVVNCAMPCKYYSETFTLVNTGTLDGVGRVHIPEVDMPSIGANGIKCIESGDVNGQVYNGSTYVAGSPVGAGVASSEPEFVAEAGGWVGQIMVSGLGVDAGSDSGPAQWIMSKHVDVVMWFDKNGDGDFDDSGELIIGDPTGVNPVKLDTIACTQIVLGTIPGAQGSQPSGPGGGWGSYFKYHVDSQTMIVPLVAGQFILVGSVLISNDGTNLYVTFDTSGSGWTMSTTHLYASKNPPSKLAPGQFPYKHSSLPNVAIDTYTIPLSGLGAAPCNDIYIAAHADVNRNGSQETAWGQGSERKFKIQLHLQQVEYPDWPDPQTRYWPTNVFQGDQCNFDMVFSFEGS